jgi:predicted O-methyltransferase YrrM
MDRSRRRFASDLYLASRAHDQGRSNRLQRFRNVEPETAELLGVLIRASAARRLLELGTSNGYSTIWLADAVEATGGRLVTVDIDPERTELARQTLHEVRLDGVVDFRAEDAELTLRQSADAAWDFVFLDSERPAYVDYVGDLVRTLAPGGILAVDNVSSHEHELFEFSARIEAEESLTQTVVPVGAGLRVAVRDRRRR